MESPPGNAREVAVPVSIFHTLRRELGREVGALPTIHALHAAGFAAGAGSAPGLRASLGEGGLEATEREFWGRLAQHLSRRGWGRLAHRNAHEAVGLLESGDWIESDTGEEDADAACSFTSGFLSGLFSELAGGPVAVLEVQCRGRGDDSCCFAFGSEAAIHELYGHLLEGRTLDGALATL